MLKLPKSRVKLIRKFGSLPLLTQKSPTHRLKTPGQHGKIISYIPNRCTIKDDYKLCLTEKQRVRLNYCLLEKSFSKYYKLALKSKETLKEALLYLLESRLDTLLVRFGFSKTILSSRQLISHKHILVNSKIINISSYACKKGDIISHVNKNKSLTLIQNNLNNFNDLISLPSYLSLNKENLIGTIIGKINGEKSIDFDEQKLNRYYFKYN